LLFGGVYFSFSRFSHDNVMTQIEILTHLPIAQAASPGGGLGSFLPIILPFRRYVVPDHRAAAQAPESSR